MSLAGNLVCALIQCNCWAVVLEDTIRHLIPANLHVVTLLPESVQLFMHGSARVALASSHTLSSVATGSIVSMQAATSSRLVVYRC